VIPRNRMILAAIALIGAFVSTYLLLYKLGYVGSLACGVGGGCEVVQASRYAFFLGLPVAAWGVGGYIAILAVALAGARPRFAQDRRVPLALLALTALAFAFSLYLSALEGWVIRAWCRWCIASAILATLAFLFALPEARRLRRR
jgi:uncharacterized membrane protein